MAGRQACKLSRDESFSTYASVRSSRIPLSAMAPANLLIPMHHAEDRREPGKNWIACKIDHRRAMVEKERERVREREFATLRFAETRRRGGPTVNVAPPRLRFLVRRGVGGSGVVVSLFAPSSSSSPPASLFSIPGPILIRQRDAAARSLLCMLFPCTWQTKCYALVSRRCEIDDRGSSRKTTRPDFRTVPRERARLERTRSTVANKTLRPSGEEAPTLSEPSDEITQGGSSFSLSNC